MATDTQTASPTVKVEPAVSNSLSVINPNEQAMLSLVEQKEKEFELAQRMAKVYAGSTLVPKEYQNNIANVIIAQNMANRLGADLLMVMQNLYIVHGRPGWSSQFLIATFNTCGRFSAIHYDFAGKSGTAKWACRAYATELSTGDRVDGTWITMEMAQQEGWSTKNGSKWRTMPGQMLRYRAAAFFIRATAPEIAMGLMTTEELVDSSNEVQTSQGATVTDLLGGGGSVVDVEPSTEETALDGVIRDIGAAESVEEVQEIVTEFWSDPNSSDEDKQASKAAADARTDQLRE